MGRCTKRPPCCCCCCCVLAWNIAEIPPSSEGCCSLVKQVILVTKNVYNTSGTDVSHRFSNIYVSQHSNGLRGIYDGCFAEVLSPFLGNPPVSCPTCLQGATSTHRLQVLEGHLHSKALYLCCSFFLLSLRVVSWRCPLIWIVIPKEVTPYILLQWKWKSTGSVAPPFADDPMIYFCLPPFPFFSSFFFFVVVTKTRAYLSW